MVAGVALWCTLGVAALDASTTPPRVVGLLPPLWLLVTFVVIATAAAILSRVWAVPLLLGGILIVPWTGIPIAPLLVWQGPLCALLWLIIAVAVLEAPPRRWWLADSPAAVALIACGIVGLMQVVGTPQRTTGDEPHYLIIANSLIEDGDVDLTNDYDEARHQAFYPGSLEPRHAILTPSGRQYSLHGHGVSLLVLPGFLAGGVIGARMTVVMVTVFGLTLLWIALKQATGSVAAAWAAIAGLGLQIPIWRAGLLYLSRRLSRRAGQRRHMHRLVAVARDRRA